ncbi:MAG TPA: SRPBCC family protein [Flavobacteriaceae bacterium]|nr:SRPBCC family protein [Flavobacteriaceae bacterium]HPF10598.1 SRPBCC family protein [Flavobacteriaceae bacterium]HQU20880.1 SRPBCC family protein [Flavobacteriaceae bacterium]HQU64364.1 SRPBCC family protein [Flavobacteriaceae bacterium]HRW43287.1 SRPBCC family protein [Flavobacteriaceae bacterium]
MKIHSLHTTQWLPTTIDTAWEFLSDPKNLCRITPSEMGFEIISGADKGMYPGQIIEYWVRPFSSIKTKWITEITHVADRSYFVDEQRFGPYALWHHKHFLKEKDEGVEMEDLIHYKLPFGILGQWMEPLLIRPKLEKIFEFRRQKLTEIFDPQHA